MQNPRVQYNIPHSPIANPITSLVAQFKVLPRPQHKKNTSNIPSDYLSSTPTSEQNRENPFNPPATTEHLPFWMTQAFTQGEPNLVNDTIDVSSDTTLSLLETLSLPSTHSITQNSQTPSPSIFPTNLDARYRKNSTNTNNIQLRLDWNTFLLPLHYLDNIMKVTDYTTDH